MESTITEGAPAMTDKQKKYAWDIRYNREHTTQITLRLNNNTDQDIITYLRSVTNKQGLIKNLLRQYMHRMKQGTRPE